MMAYRSLLVTGLLLLLVSLFFNVWQTWRTFEQIVPYLEQHGRRDTITRPTRKSEDESSSYQGLLQGLEMTESLKLLLNAAFSHQVNITQETTERMITDRCTKYGLKTRSHRRKIFWGTLIADDSWHVLGIAAMEYHGLLDGVVFVESNTTQNMNPRKLRFEEGSVNHRLVTNSRLWGTENIHVEQFAVPPHNESFYGTKPLWRENDQRDEIFRVWKEMGITPDDIGFLSDTDEVASREFLLVLQCCEVPQFLPGKSVLIKNGTESYSYDNLPMDRPHDCFEARVSSFSIVFEGSPRCMQVPRRWSKPSFVIGECIEGIGDASLRLPSRRAQRYTANIRDDNWRVNSVNIVELNNQSIPMGPLWDATDIRMLGTNHHPIQEYPEVGGPIRPTGFHIHNFFNSIAVLRNKYLTYGHPVGRAMEMLLEEIHPNDVGFMVNCLKDGSGKNESIWLQPTPDDWKGMPLPVALSKVPEYTKLRHGELQRELAEDERQVLLRRKVDHDDPAQKAH